MIPVKILKKAYQSVKQVTKPLYHMNILRREKLLSYYLG